MGAPEAPSPRDVPIFPVSTSLFHGKKKWFQATWLFKFDAMKSGETSAAQPVVWAFFHEFTNGRSPGHSNPKITFRTSEKVRWFVGPAIRCLQVDGGDGRRKKHGHEVLGIRREDRSTKKKVYGHNHSERVRLLWSESRNGTKWFAVGISCSDLEPFIRSICAARTSRDTQLWLLSCV